MKIIYILIALFFVNTLSAQTVEENYRRSLKEVLTQVEIQYHVKINYDEKMVADRSISL